MTAVRHDYAIQVNLASFLLSMKTQIIVYMKTNKNCSKNNSDLVVLYLFILFFVFTSIDFTKKLISNYNYTK